jgi:hypothetical protein
MLLSFMTGSLKCGVVVAVKAVDEVGNISPPKRNVAAVFAALLAIVIVDFNTKNGKLWKRFCCRFCLSLVRHIQLRLLSKKQKFQAFRYTKIVLIYTHV